MLHQTRYNIGTNKSVIQGGLDKMDIVQNLQTSLN